MHSSLARQSRTIGGQGGAREPLQARSRATRGRILGALSRLLQAKVFDEISVAELTSAAKCSMSSFYALFSTKEALLDAFFERFFQVSTERTQAALALISSADSIPRRVRRLVRFLLQSYRENRGLLRALVFHERAHPSSGFALRARNYKDRFASAVPALLLSERPRATDPRTAASLRFGLWLVVSCIERIVLFDDPVTKRQRISERRLVEELGSVLLGFVERGGEIERPAGEPTG